MARVMPRLSSAATKLGRLPCGRIGAHALVGIGLATRSSAVWQGGRDFAQATASAASQRATSGHRRFYLSHLSSRLAEGVPELRTAGGDRCKRLRPAMCAGDLKFHCHPSPNNAASPPSSTKPMRSEPSAGKPWRNWTASRSPSSLRCLGIRQEPKGLAGSTLGRGGA